MYEMESCIGSKERLDDPTSHPAVCAVKHNLAQPRSLSCHFGRSSARTQLGSAFKSLSILFSKSLKKFIEIEAIVRSES